MLLMHYCPRDIVSRSTDDGPSDLSRRVETECPASQARVTARELTRYYNACFRSLGITAELVSLLVGIGGIYEPTLAQLAARAGFDATTLGRNVKSLERRDLVRPLRPTIAPACGR